MMLRMAVVGGALLGVWRLVVRLQKRPTYPDAHTLIRAVEGETRLLPFETIANLRDAGGYATVDGRHVRRGLLYRAASLAYVSDADMAQLATLGLRLVCDLRTPQEMAAAPDRLPQGARHWHVPMLQMNNRYAEAARMVMNPRYLDGLTRQIYITLVEQQAESFAALYREWLQPEVLPALVHCSAGKDRTGITVALLLRVLGVPEAVVLADYSQTNAFYDYILNLSTDLIKSLQRLGLRQSDLVPLLLADPANLEALLRHIDHCYGSVEGYFRAALGFSDAELTALRAVFLEEK